MHSALKNIFFTVITVNFVMLNIAVGFLVYKNLRSSSTIEVERPSSETDEIEKTQMQQSQFSCDENCQKVIEEKVAQLIPSPSVSSSVTPLPTSKSSITRFVSYIPIPGSGNTSSNTWVDLAGTEFSFSVSDYVGFKEAYFEANIKLFNGNGNGYIRLYDISNVRAVDGSEISTSSQTSTAVSSGKISIWQGNNRYKVQARSLTADTTYFESGRIKIINEQ